MKGYIPTAIAIAACIIIPMLFGRVTLATGSIREAVLCHFTHANIFHAAANIIALAAFKPRFSTLLVAYPAAALAALCPITHLSLPTCGLSAVVCAAYARRYVAWNKNVWPFLAVQIPFIFLPNFNYRIHILAFTIAYILWKISYSRKIIGA